MKTLYKYLRDEGLFGYNYWYLIQHPWKVPYESYYRIKWFIQRGYRGYADCDNWDLGYYLARWMPQAIRNLKKGIGTPGSVLCALYPKKIEYTTQEYETASMMWQDILEQIAMGFEAINKQAEELNWPDSPRAKFLDSLVAQGMKQFVKYYQNLWD